MPRPTPFDLPRWAYAVPLLLGLGFAAMHAQEVYQVRRVRTDYKQTACTVLNARLQVLGSHRRYGRSGYIPVITFRFTVDGQSYTVTGYSKPPVPIGDWRKATDVIVRHQPGRTAVCWYDPYDPTQAVLTRDGDEHALDTAGMLAVGFVVVGAGLVLWRWLLARPSPQADHDR